MWVKGKYTAGLGLRWVGAAVRVSSSVLGEEDIGGWDLWCAGGLIAAGIPVVSLPGRRRGTEGRSGPWQGV